MEDIHKKDDRPTNAFRYASKGLKRPKFKPPKPTLRDKDNAQPRIQPPRFVTTPAHNLAPPGMSGIKTNKRLYGQERTVRGSAPKPPQYKPGERGTVAKTFKSIAGKDHDRGIER